MVHFTLLHGTKVGILKTSNRSRVGSARYIYIIAQMDIGFGTASLTFQFFHTGRRALQLLTKIQNAPQDALFAQMLLQVQMLRYT